MIAPRLFLSLALAAPVAAQTGSVLAVQKVSETQGGFEGQLSTGGRFGLTVSSLGDLDGDGLTDLIVGEEADDDGGTDRGAVWA